MKMVGCAGATFRTIVENNESRKFTGQLHHIRKSSRNALVGMFYMRYGQMLWEDRKRIDQNEVVIPEEDAILLGR